MKEFTQTSFGDRGNCWQTSVACVLEVDPATLPAQALCDMPGEDGARLPPFFGNVLHTYLRKHHNLAYVELYAPSEITSVLSVEPGRYYFLTGTTVRTGTPGGSPRHVVVARDGQVVWDPHPSRAGLLGDLKLALLLPYPKEWEMTMRREDACVCPACQNPGA